MSHVCVHMKDSNLNKPQNHGQGIVSSVLCILKIFDESLNAPIRIFNGSEKVIRTNNENWIHVTGSYRDSGKSQG